MRMLTLLLYGSDLFVRRSEDFDNKLEVFDNGSEVFDNSFYFVALVDSPWSTVHGQQSMVDSAWSMVYGRQEYWVIS